MMSAGEGLAEGPFGPRLGWLLIVHFFNVIAFSGDGHLHGRVAGAVETADLEVTAITVIEVVFRIGGPGVQHGLREVVSAQLVVPAQGLGNLVKAVGVDVSNLHVYLQAPDLPRRAGQRCAAHVLKYTLIERMCQALKTHSNPDTPKIKAMFPAGCFLTPPKFPQNRVFSLGKVVPRKGIFGHFGNH